MDNGKDKNRNPFATMTTLVDLWSIPPIQDAIASHLEIVDLLQCILISKSFHDTFIPFLWTNIEPWDNHTIPSFLASPGQSRHRHHVKSLSVSVHDTLMLHEHLQEWGHFPNLISLEGHDIQSTSLGTEFFMYASLHPRLSRLALDGQAMQSLDLENLMILLDKRDTLGLATLRILELNVTVSISTRKLALVLGKSIGLERLCLQCRSESIIHGEDVADILFLQDSRIREFSFSFPQRGAVVDALVVRFLGRCPLLEQLELEAMLDEETVISALADVLAGCSRLWNLVLPRVGQDSVGLIRILKSCPSLKRLEFPMVHAYSPVIEAICTHHGTTLQYLECDSGQMVPLESYFRLAHYCPALKLLDMSIVWHENLESQTGTRDALKSLPWSCMGLESTCLFFATSASDPEVLKSLYQQLGRMVNLESLTLYTRISEDSDFVEGFEEELDQLSGLKKLCTLYLTNIRPDDHTIWCLEQMVAMWPKLEHIQGFSGLLMPQGMTLIEAVRAGQCRVPSRERLFFSD